MLTFFQCCTKQDYMRSISNLDLMHNPIPQEMSQVNLEELEEDGSVALEHSDINEKISNYQYKIRWASLGPSHNTSPMSTRETTERSTKPLTKLLRKHSVYIEDKKIISPKFSESMKKNIGFIASDLLRIKKKPCVIPKDHFVLTPSSNSNFKFATTYFRPRNESAKGANSTHFTIDAKCMTSKYTNINI